MAKMKLRNVENIEGKYHLMFLEGKNMIQSAKNDTRYALVSFLVFVGLLLLFVVLTGLNMYYIYFAGAFLIVFLIMIVYLKIQKHKGKKQCMYAVKNSKSTNIVAKQTDLDSGRAIVKSMSSTLDKHDANKKFPGAVQKYMRKRRQEHIVDAIMKFEKESKKNKG